MKFLRQPTSFHFSLLEADPTSALGIDPSRVEDLAQKTHQGKLLRLFEKRGDRMWQLLLLTSDEAVTGEGGIGPATIQTLTALLEARGVRHNMFPDLRERLKTVCQKTWCTWNRGRFLRDLVTKVDWSHGQIEALSESGLCPKTSCDELFVFAGNEHALQEAGRHQLDTVFPASSEASELLEYCRRRNVVTVGGASMLAISDADFPISGRMVLQQLLTTRLVE